MRTLKKTLTLVLVLAMMFSLCITASADFTDDAEIKYTEAVEVMAALGVLEGNPDGSFNPKGTLTRAEAATIIVRLLDAEDLAVAAEATFADVAANHWAAAAIAYCAEEGIIDGYGDGNFGPKDTLTAYQWAKMLLVAIGYEGEYTGAAWQIAVAKDAADAGIFAGNLKADKTVGATREEAALYALNAAKDGIDTVYYEVTNGTNTYEFDSWSDVSLFVALNPGYVWEEKVATSDSILEDVFEVDYDRATDASGRPMTKYEGKILGEYGLSFVDAPIATYDTAMTEKELYAAIGATGIQGKYDKYIVMDTVNLDGAVAAQAVAITGTKDFEAADKTVPAAGTVVIAKNDKSNVAGMGNGTITEIYATAKANHYVMVATNQYLGTVSSTTKANEQAGTDRYITIAGAGTFETEDFATGDIVLYTMNKLGVASVVAPEAVTGLITKVTSAGVYTIGGDEYEVSQTYTGTALAINQNGSWYLDSCGNVIGIKNAAATIWNYGFLAGYAAQDKNTENVLGVGAKEAAEKFVMINAAGEKVVLDGAFKTDAKTGKVTDWVVDSTTGWYAKDGNDHAINRLVRYAVDGNGKVVAVEGVANGTTGAYASSALKAEKGVATLDGKYVTDSTLYIAYQPAAGTAPAKFATYTGYTAIPKEIAGSAYEYFYATKADGSLDTTKIAAVVLTVASAEAQSDANFVWFASLANEAETTAEGTVVTYTDVYLDGVKGEIKTAGAISGVEAGVLYEYTTNTTTGLASVITSGNYGRLDTTCTIEKIEAGYYATNHSSVKTIYTDANTVYFQVDPITKAIEKVEALPALSAAYDLKQISAMNSDPSFAPEYPADVVYFYVAVK